MLFLRSGEPLVPRKEVQLKKLLTIFSGKEQNRMHGSFVHQAIVDCRSPGMKMDGWMEGGMEGWRDGGMEGWRDGGMEGWMEGWRDGWMDGRMDG